nr:bifunctional (p)ppGpp synthetase/guanosine-3',5'-bis(diphosphate) 3'-pyrophosphohydrolase [Desulfobacterales bacterium]
MIRITDILDKIASYHPEADLDLVRRAYIYSARMHEGQVRLSGEPYLSHPLEVASLIADMKLDLVCVVAALLHDVLEDTRATVGEVTSLFGEDVCHIISGISKLSSLNFQSYEDRQAENIRRMILAMAKDIRVILIKLADRLHNMRTLQYHKWDKQIRIARETIDIYAPLANRLGIYWMTKELEDISFMYLSPERYREISNMVKKRKEEQQEYVDTVQNILKKKMKDSGLECEVLGRHKHIYSIYRKMESQNLEFDEIYDILAFRIILNTVQECYEALGVIHSIWKPVPNRFKDYIGFPKPNMYQSLHTTVIGPFGERMEVQIRTKEMDLVANEGIAAHWQYKENTIDEKSGKRFAWLRKLIEHHKELKDPREFLETVRTDLFPEEVYVFTPKGDVLAFPRGATPVDFAYAIHSEVGHACAGAKVNGRMVPLKYKLKNGDTVQVITASNHHPSKDWLSFVRTAKARSKIRQWIKGQERERSLTVGREMCEKMFRKHRLNPNELLNSEKVHEVVKEFGHKTLDDLLVSVGYGNITPMQVLRQFISKSDDLYEEESILDRVERATKKKRKERVGIVVKGVDDPLIRFGKCCNPLPGDPVTGYITRGQGITVHRADCINVLKGDPERVIDLEWDTDSHEVYPVKIYVECMDKIGLLADISAAISKSEANILGCNIQTREDKKADCYFTIAVSSIQHLQDVINSVKKIQDVLRITRLGTQTPH